MKKILSALMIIILFYAAPLLSESEYSFEGTIISVNGDSIELKKGAEEIVLFFNDGSNYFYKGNEIAGDSLEICQKARASYIVQNEKNFITRLDVLAEGYCSH